MDEIMSRRHRNRLIRLFRRTAKKNLLTKGDGNAVLDILRGACKRGLAGLEEEQMKIRIESGGKDDAE